MPDTPIPPEAVEAAARAICELTGNDPQNWMYWNPEATAAIRAALAAWPGMEHMAGDEAFPFYYLILPLITENPDA